MWILVRLSSPQAEKSEKKFYKVGTGFERRFRKSLIIKHLRGGGAPRAVSR
jgi:hypothetical protein